MAQLTIYLDDVFKQQIDASAKRARISVSKWVAERLRLALADEWPAGYFELFGSIADDDSFKRAEPLKPDDDAARIDM